MDEYEQLRDQLSEELREPVQGWAFETAIELGFVDEYLTGEIKYAEFEHRYLRIIDQEDIRRRRSRERRESREESGDSSPDYRPAALALVFAIEAAEDDSVRSFRADILDNSLLDWEGVEQWVTDQALRDGEPTEWVNLPIDSHGNVPVSDSKEPPAEGDCVVEGQTEHYANRSTMQLAYPGSNNWVRYCPVRAGGVLDWLRIIARMLNRRYGWKEADATGFVLSDVCPAGQVSGEMRSPWPWWKARRSAILRIPYWATPEEVSNTYREMRNQLLRGDPKPRALSEQRSHLGVFAFQHRSGYTWDEVMTLWNKQQLGPRYRNVRVFTRDARQAFKRITGESLHWRGR